MRLLKITIITVAVMAVAVTAGCVNLCKESVANPTATPTATPIPTPTIVATPTLPAVNDTIDRQYNFVDRFDAGIGYYNDGIQNMYAAQTAYNATQYLNASQIIESAIGDMNSAKDQFTAMQQFASNGDEYNLSGKWFETADDYAICFGYLQQGYLEMQNQSSRAQPNFVKERFYFQQAQYYNNVAQQNFAKAKELEQQTFLTQQ